MQNLRTTIGILIKKHRKRLKLTQGELAEKIGVDPKYISRIETGVSSPSLNIVEKIFEVLNIHAKDLFEVESQNLDKPTMISMINENLQSTSIKNVKIIKNILDTLINND